MLEAAKRSLGLFEEQFGPYQYKQLKIAEIPDYPGAATAYPNTLFCTEEHGFLMDLNDSKKIDYVSLTVAHELSHQWWAGQLEPAEVEGNKVLTESLAQYSEILMLEKTLGRDFIRPYMINQLETYLFGRGSGRLESPLYRSTGKDQAHIYYQKGALVMYALKELLGREMLNLAMQAILKEHAYPRQQATTVDLLEKLYSLAPVSNHRLIDDWMKKVVFYDLQIRSASCALREDGRYEVSMQVITRKTEDRGDGTEVPMRVDESFDIGIFSGHPDAPGFQEHLLHLEKHPFTGDTTNLALTVDRKPEVVCIDPFSYMIDRNRTDNLKILAKRP